MEAYRSAEDVADLRIAELRGELSELRASNLRLAHQIERCVAETSVLSARLADAGPGAGEVSGAQDRVALLAMLLAVAGFPLLSLHAAWDEPIAVDFSILPAILLLGVPGALAAWIGAPHARTSFGCRVATWLGLGFGALATLHALLGVLR